MGVEVLDAFVMSARMARRTERRSVSLARMAVLRSVRRRESVGEGDVASVEEVDDDQRGLRRHLMQMLDRGNGDARVVSSRRMGDRDAIVVIDGFWIMEKRRENADEGGYGRECGSMDDGK